jgi:hypothetical protein
MGNQETFRVAGLELTGAGLVVSCSGGRDGIE